LVGEPGGVAAFKDENKKRLKGPSILWKRIKILGEHVKCYLKERRYERT
jgi:hypothetical protein